MNILFVFEGVAGRFTSFRQSLRALPEMLAPGGILNRFRGRQASVFGLVRYQGT